MGLRKNVVGQKLAVYLVDPGASYEAVLAPQTGQQASITATISKDGGNAVATDDVNPTQLSATDFPGVYLFDLAAAEVNADHIDVRPIHGTATFTFEPGLVSLDLEDMQTLANTFLSPISTYFNSTIVPILRRGVTTQEFSGTGWLSRVGDKIRRWVDESAINAKFTSTVLLEMMRSSMRELITDYQILAEFQIFCRYTFTVADDVQEYVLPPNVGQVHRVAQIDTVTNIQAWELLPEPHYSPYHPGWALEGNILRLSANDSGLVGEEFEVLYSPNGDLSPHVGSILGTGISDDGLTITFDTTPTDGSLDLRPNAYGGYIFRTLSSSISASNVIQDRVITSSSLSSGTVTATLRNALSPIPADGATVVYEVVPPLGALFEDVLALHVARSMVTSCNNEDRLNILTQRFREAARALRLQMVTMQTRRAPRFDTRSHDNSELPWRAY